MSTPKQRRRNIGANRLEPIDWHEFANDAVLNGNMSTLYNRPPSEESAVYASPEALVEIKKRIGRPAESAVVVGFDATFLSVDKPTVGGGPTVGTSKKRGKKSIHATIPTVGAEQEFPVPPVAVVSVDIPTVGVEPTVGAVAEFPVPSVAVVSVDIPTVGVEPTVGTMQT